MRIDERLAAGSTASPLDRLRGVDQTGCVPTAS